MAASSFLDRCDMMKKNKLESGARSMKRLIFILILVLILSGCSAQASVDVVATTKPVYDLAVFLCQGTDLQISQLITENVSCLHDYSLSVSQVKKLESAEHVVISGAGLEAFMEDLLRECKNVIDASVDVSVLECTEEHEHGHDHAHEVDPHIWLAPDNARQMAENICKGLCASYPDLSVVFHENLSDLDEKFDALQLYAKENLSDLSCRDLVTFHDGFGHMARAFSLTVAAAVEEESGSEASAKELISLIGLVKDHKIPSVFVEVNGSASAAAIIAEETGAAVFTLDMGMESDYFDMMYRNIDTLKEALG